MITLRQMATAFLLHENQLLMMEKANRSSFLPGMVVPVGGHLEQHEINTTREACLREIEEETRLTNDDLKTLDLRYIILRIKDTEVRIQYVYFGIVNRTNVVDSEEGRLFWVNLKEASKLNVTETTKHILEHYTNVSMDNSDVFVGTMKANQFVPDITWALLEDWEVQNGAKLSEGND